MKISKNVKFGQHTLSLQTGEIARQADGAVLVNMAGTQVLCTVVGKKTDTLGNDFFPLTVHYQEKSYAAGKIPGGFNKREGRPSENETLVSRLIDRPIRPLFPEEFHNEIQIIATVLSLNPEVPADILAIIGASTALAISGIPFKEPIGAARVGYKDGIYILNPSYKILEDSKLDLVLAGTQSAILMVESEAIELSEEIVLGAIVFGHEMMQNIITAIKELAIEVNKPAWEWQQPAKSANFSTIAQIISEENINLANAYLIKEKPLRHQQLNLIKENIIQKAKTTISELTQEEEKEILKQIYDSEKNIVRKRILAREPRIDGRDNKTVRPISISLNFLERTHGSVLFTRGETQAIVVTTLGNERDAQILDSLEGESKDKFMLHYNFPPYSVGETGALGTPKRREIGHGRLAKRGLKAVLPSTSKFPYVIRIVADITESNGSSSMATVCGASLSLMGAGVPIKAPVAGIAMGLIKEDLDFAVLTDILGDEDHLGDMDFKVAGTVNGITALQMDMKITGITQEIMKDALEQAYEARIHILNIMNASVDAPHELSPYTPRITTMKVAEDKIRTIIGKGGSTIKGIIENTGVAIDIDDKGVVQLFSANATSLEEAKRQIQVLTAEIEIGQIYHGKVSKIVDFGAFINLLPGKDGLLHISQICEDRNQKIQSVLHEGQEIEVYVAGVDKQGRIKLEWKNKTEEAPPLIIENPDTNDDSQ